VFSQDRIDYCILRFLQLSLSSSPNVEA
jgi:hypothetical protein